MTHADKVYIHNKQQTAKIVSYKGLKYIENRLITSDNYTVHAIKMVSLSYKPYLHIALIQLQLAMSVDAFRAGRTMHAGSSAGSSSKL